MTAALRVMQLGAIAIVVAASTLMPFELDRFFVPKELVLHLTAVLAGLFALKTPVNATWIDRLLLGVLALSIVSAALATNVWAGGRAVAITASGIVVFWVARALPRRELVTALAIAVTLVAVTSLLQTYGIDVDLFSEQRAPGGTLGNRNFVAHAAAFGMPLLLLAAVGARTRMGFLAGAAGIIIVTASLVLTRSRAAWLAFAVVLVICFLGMMKTAWRRLAVLIVLACGGVAAALLIPNTLRWKDDNPYLATVRRVADYEQGSGRGRLVQYEQSLRMAARYPILGVGPGNWAVVYPAHAARHDPSLSDSEGGTTSNPWPSSDWVAHVSERGIVTAVLLAAVFLGIALAGVRQLFAAVDAEERLAATALLGTLAGAVVTGLFDAVLLLALPTFLVWAALGALWSPPPTARPMRKVIVFAVIVLAAAGAVRSAMQLTAMQIYTTRGDRASLAQAARIDPGNYRVRLRLARMGGRSRCEHARAARDLYPNAEAARAAARRCGDRL